MFRRAALVQVIWPGSEVPGPPRGGPKYTLAPGAGGGAGRTEATSKVRLDCPKIGRIKAAAKKSAPRIISIIPFGVAHAPRRDSSRRRPGIGTSADAAR